MEMPEPPQGFAPSRRTSPFLDMVGPLYETAPGPGYRIAIYLDQRHANMGGKGHGGMSAAMLDILLGRLCALSRTPPQLMVTVSLTTDYLAPAPLGAWLVARGRVDRMGSRLAFASGELFAGETMVARGHGVFNSAARDESINSDG
jgi:acyl-coenzyme A thioesterase 13